PSVVLRVCCCGSSVPVYASGAPRARARRPACRADRGRRAATRDVARGGAAIAAIPDPDRDQLLLLRNAFRPDHPHRELCRELRHSVDRGGHDLQRRGTGGGGGAAPPPPPPPAPPRPPPARVP